MFHSLIGIFMGCLTLNIKCLYVMMAKEVHGSHLSAIYWHISANVFVAVDTISLYVFVEKKAAKMAFSLLRFKDL